MADESNARRYKVLEERDLADLVLELLEAKGVTVDDDALELLRDHEVYHSIATPVARNAEHAFRQAAKDLPAGERQLVAASERWLTSQTIVTRKNTTVSIGADEPVAVG